MSFESGTDFLSTSGTSMAKQLHRELRERLRSIQVKIQREDEAEFAERFAATVSLLPDKTALPSFALLVRRLWTDGAREATLNEWNNSVSARFAEAEMRLGGLARGLKPNGEVSPRGIQAVAKLLVQLHRRQKALDGWLETCRA